MHTAAKITIFPTEFYDRELVLQVLSTLEPRCFCVQSVSGTRRWSDRFYLFCNFSESVWCETTKRQFSLCVLPHLCNSQMNVVRFTLRWNAGSCLFCWGGGCRWKFSFTNPRVLLIFVVVWMYTFCLWTCAVVPPLARGQQNFLAINRCSLMSRGCCTV